MAVPQRVPLPVAHDRGQRVVLQQQDPARRQPGGPLGHRRRLVGGVHQPEAVEDDVRRDRRRPRSAPGRPADRATSRRAGCRTRPRVPPAGSQPAPATRATASAACSTRAAGSAPRGSSGVVGSVSSWARAHRAQSHICSGWTGSGPGSPTGGKWSAAGWSPRSRTTSPVGRAAGAAAVRERRSQAVIGGPVRLARCGRARSYHVAGRGPGVRPDAAPRRPGPVHPDVRRRGGGRARRRRGGVRAGLAVPFGPGCAAGPARARRRRRGEARALRPRRGPRRARRRPAGLADVRGARGVPARRRRRSSTSTCRRGCSTASRPSPTWPTSATASTARTTRPPTWRCGTTTPTWHRLAPSRSS